MLALTGAVSFVVAFIAVRVLLSRFGRLALDEPNARSLHQRPLFHCEAVEIEHHIVYPAVRGLDVGEEAEGAGALLLEVRKPLGFLGEGEADFLFEEFGEEGSKVERYPSIPGRVGRR